MADGTDEEQELVTKRWDEFVAQHLAKTTPPSLKPSTNLHTVLERARRLHADGIALLRNKNSQQALEQAYVVLKKFARLYFDQLVKHSNFQTPEFKRDREWYVAALNDAVNNLEYIRELVKERIRDELFESRLQDKYDQIFSDVEFSDAFGPAFEEAAKSDASLFSQAVGVGVGVGGEDNNPSKPEQFAGSSIQQAKPVEVEYQWQTPPTPHDALRAAALTPELAAAARTVTPPPSSSTSALVYPSLGPESGGKQPTTATASPAQPATAVFLPVPQPKGSASPPCPPDPIVRNEELRKAIAKINIPRTAYAQRNDDRHERERPGSTSSESPSSRLYDLSATSVPVPDVAAAYTPTKYAAAEPLGSSEPAAGTMVASRASDVAEDDVELPPAYGEAVKIKAKNQQQEQRRTEEAQRRQQQLQLQQEKQLLEQQRRVQEKQEQEEARERQEARERLAQERFQREQEEMKAQKVAAELKFAQQRAALQEKQRQQQELMLKQLERERQQRELEKQREEAQKRERHQRENQLLEQERREAEVRREQERRKQLLLAQQQREKQQLQEQQQREEQQRRHQQLLQQQQQQQREEARQRAIAEEEHNNAKQQERLRQEQQQQQQLLEAERERAQQLQKEAARRTRPPPPLRGSATSQHSDPPPYAAVVVKSPQRPAVVPPTRALRPTPIPRGGRRFLHPKYILEQKRSFCTRPEALVQSSRTLGSRLDPRQCRRRPAYSVAVEDITALQFVPLESEVNAAERFLRILSLQQRPPLRSDELMYLDWPGLGVCDLQLIQDLLLIFKLRVLASEVRHEFRFFRGILGGNLALTPPRGAPALTQSQLRRVGFLLHELPSSTVFARIKCPLRAHLKDSVEFNMEPRNLESLVDERFTDNFCMDFLIAHFNSNNGGGFLQKGYIFLPTVYQLCAEVGDTKTTEEILRAAVHACFTAQRHTGRFNMNGILVPLLRGMHWTLALISFSRRRIEYFDSLQNTFVAGAVQDTLQTTASRVRSFCSGLPSLGGGLRHRSSEWNGGHPQGTVQGRRVASSGSCGSIVLRVAELMVNGGNNLQESYANNRYCRMRQMCIISAYARPDRRGSAPR